MMISPDNNVDIDALKVLSDEDFSTLTRNNQNLMGPVAKLRLKIKTLLAGSGDNDSAEIVLNNVIDIRKVLLTDIRGKSIYKFYNKNKKLDKEQQKLIIDIVLDHSINKDEPSTISTREIEKLVDGICSIFPTESKVCPKK